jgi:thiamine pyrophosphokinase
MIRRAGQFLYASLFIRSYIVMDLDSVHKGTCRYYSQNGKEKRLFLKNVQNWTDKGVLAR